VISQGEPYWYAFTTKPRHEKKVKTFLENTDVTSYLPLRKVLSQWSDRKKWVEKPLFPSYIFCHIPYNQRYTVLQIPGMVRVVGFNQTPMPVKDYEIETMKMILAQDFDIHVKNGLVVGDHVRISSGVMYGYEGWIVEERGKYYFVLQIHTINKSILVDSRHLKLEKIDTVSMIHQV